MSDTSPANRAAVFVEFCKRCEKRALIASADYDVGACLDIEHKSSFTWGVYNSEGIRWKCPACHLYFITQNTVKLDEIFAINNTESSKKRV